MGCLLTDDLTNTCDDKFGVGGIDEVIYLANVADVDEVVLNTDGSVKDVVFLAGKGFYKIENALNKPAATAAPQNNDGMFSYLHTVSFALSRVDQEALNRWHEARGGEFYALVISNKLNSPTTPGVNKERRIYFYGFPVGLSDALGEGSRKGAGKEVASTIMFNLSSLEEFPEREIVPENIGAPPDANPNAKFIQDRLHP